MYNIELVKAEMSSKNIRQADLLRLIDIKTGEIINKVSLSYILTGKRVATAQQQDLICKALDIPIATRNNFIKLTRQSKANHDLLRSILEQSMQQGIKITSNFNMIFAAINNDTNLTKAQKVNRISSLTTFHKLKDSSDLVYPTLSIATTNRINYVRPNLIGGIPKDLLGKVIMPRKPNTTLYSIDCKQQEPLLLVNILDIKEVKSLMHTETDVYSAIYKIVYNTFPNDTQRQTIKQMWNALAYGANKYTLIQIAKENNTFINVDKIYNYFYSVDAYNDFFCRAKAQAKSGSREVLTYFNTHLRTDAPPKSLARSIASHQIQGTGSDILAFMVEKANTIAPGLISPYYTRHDEIILEVNNSIVNANTIDYLNNQFTQQIEGWLPLRVHTSILAN